MKKYIVSSILLLTLAFAGVRTLTKNEVNFSLSKGISQSQKNNKVSLPTDIKKLDTIRSVANKVTDNTITIPTLSLQKEEVENSCGAVTSLSKNQSAIDFLNQINDLRSSTINSCSQYLKEKFISFNNEQCKADIETYRQTGQRGSIFKTCSKLIGLRSWMNFNSNLATKSMKQMTKEELAEAYHGVLFDLSIAPEIRLKKATRYAAELLKRNPEDKYAMNMLIRTSMIDNENGIGYSETFDWIKRASQKQPNDFALLNHMVQRLSYAGPKGLEEIKKVLKLVPDLLSAQIIFAENQFKTPRDLIAYYKLNKSRFPHNSDKYDEIINHIMKNENYFFAVVDLSLDTVPNYM